MREQLADGDLLLCPAARTRASTWPPALRSRASRASGRRRASWRPGPSWPSGRPPWCPASHGSPVCLLRMPPQRSTTFSPSMIGAAGATQLAAPGEVLGKRLAHRFKAATDAVPLYRVGCNSDRDSSSTARRPPICADDRRHLPGDRGCKRAADLALLSALPVRPTNVATGKHSRAIDPVESAGRQRPELSRSREPLSRLPAR